MLLRKLFKNKATTIVNTGWTPAFSHTGEVITDEKAIMLSSVYACCDIKGNALGKLPLQVFQKTDKGRNRIENHPVSYLLGVRPNPYMTPFQFKHLVTVHQNIYGVAYVRISYDNKGFPNGLYLLNPPRVSVAEDAEGKRFYIDFTDNKNQTVYNEDEIIRLPYLTTDGFTPKSPIAVARETIGVMRAQQKFISSYYANGTLARGVLKIPTILNKEAKDKVREEWARMNSGIDNSHKVAIVDGGIDFDFQNMTLPVEDAQFVTSMNFNVTDIARIFRVPPHKLGLLERATWSNIESENMSFVQDTVMPSAVAWEEEMTYKLFSMKEQRDGIYVKFNLTSALRGDSQSRSQFYKTMLDSGAYSINRVLELEDESGIGPAGDVHRVDLNHVSIEIADEYQMTKATSKQSPK